MKAVEKEEEEEEEEKEEEEGAEGYRVPSRRGCEGGAA